MSCSTPATGLRTGLSSYVAAAHSAHTAPKTLVQGTGLSFAGTAALAAVAAAPAQVAVLGARVIDLPGLPPRGAPV